MVNTSRNLNELPNTDDITNICLGTFTRCKSAALTINACPPVLTPESNHFHTTIPQRKFGMNPGLLRPRTITKRT